MERKIHNMKIDFVMPWVDGTDMKWLIERKKYLPQ